MSTDFKSEYSHHDAYYARGDLLRPHFGLWDSCDPVAHCILDLAEAQNEIADLFDTDATYCIVSEAAFAAAVEKRHAAGVRLMQALENRDSWPDPKLGE